MLGGGGSAPLGDSANVDPATAYILGEPPDDGETYGLNEEELADNMMWRERPTKHAVEAIFTVHPKCNISEGGDILKCSMTVEDAKAKSLQLPGCRGFTHKGPDKGQSMVIHFKDHFDKTGKEKFLWTAWQKEDAMARLVASPEAPIGMAVETRQRVLQICLGAEHGILLTDAGIICTWGDNRYGQCGRRPCRKEENGIPHPVIDLQNEEIVQVASGRHHCVALAADGLVYAWGRNKAGQVGCGDFRDKVSPERVMLPPNKEGHLIQLGSSLGLEGSKLDRIITIGAGENSSLAASMKSEVWQWGDISTDFKDGKESSKKKGGPARTGVDLGRQVQKNRPWRVFQKTDFRSGLRPSKVSVSETACKVLGPPGSGLPPEHRDRLKDLVESARQLQDAVHKDLHALQQNDDQTARKNTAAVELSHTYAQDLQDTIQMLELQISGVEHDIDVLGTSEKSCDMQQNHIKAQIENLMRQGTQLSNKHDDYSVKVFAALGTEKKHLEDQLDEIKNFVEANQNTRMTLLDQRAEIDKEKQKIKQKLTNCKDQLDSYRRRLVTVKDLGKSAQRAAGASDTAMKFLREQLHNLNKRFEGKKGDYNYVEAQEELEHAEQNLDQCLYQTKEMVEHSGDAARAQRVQALIEDLVELRRSFCKMSAQRWMTEDLNLKTTFFEEKSVDDRRPQR